MNFDNLTLLGVVAAVATSLLILRLMAGDTSSGDRNAVRRDGVNDDDSLGAGC